MTDIYTEQKSLFLTNNESEFYFSQYEIEVIQRIWNSLRVVTPLGFAGSNLKAKGPSQESQRDDIELLHMLIPNVGRLTVLNMNSGSSVRIDADKAKHFEIKVASNILQYLRENTEDYNYRGIENSRFNDALFDYHLRAFIELISNVITELETFNYDDSAVIASSKVQSRIWNFHSSHYNLIGEGMVLAFVEEIGRDRFSPEIESIWLKFYNKLANLLLFEGQDSYLDMPILDDSLRNRFPSDTTTISTISPRSSINYPDDEIYSIRELPSPKYLEKPLIEAEAYTLLKGIEEEDDDSYDLINAFDVVQLEANTSKKGPKSSLRRFNSRRRSLF